MTTDWVTGEVFMSLMSQPRSSTAAMCWSGPRIQVATQMERNQR